MVMNAKKVILKTYYCLGEELLVFDANPLHNKSYDNVKVEIKTVTKTMCGIDFEFDVIEIEGEEPICCEVLSTTNLDDKLIIKLCQDWG